LEIEDNHSSSSSTSASTDAALSTDELVQSTAAAPAPKRHALHKLKNHKKSNGVHVSVNVEA